MEKRPKKNKAETPTMVLKSDKSNLYIYKLKNGDELTFESKEFPTEIKPKQTNQYQLF